MTALTEEKIDELRKLEMERDAWRRVVQDYTPGGSEFTTPEECAAYVRDLRSRQHDLIAKTIREKREADTRADGLEERVRELEAALRPFADEHAAAANAGWTTMPGSVRVPFADCVKAARALVPEVTNG